MPNEGVVTVSLQPEDDKSVTVGPGEVDVDFC
jgi:hypothetical protein